MALKPTSPSTHQLRAQHTCWEQQNTAEGSHHITFGRPWLSCFGRADVSLPACPCLTNKTNKQTPGVQLPPGLMDEVKAAVTTVEKEMGKKFGDKDNTLLFRCVWWVVGGGAVGSAWGRHRHKTGTAISELPSELLRELALAVGRCLIQHRSSSSPDARLTCCCCVRPCCPLCSAPTRAVCALVLPCLCLA